MAKNINEIVSYFENLYKNGAIYLWGANGEIITKELCEDLLKKYGTSNYNNTYYNNKLKEGKGKIGADCSGSLYPMSGFDDTANGYYNRCSTKGVIKNINKNKPCLVFKYQNSIMVHVGLYLGNGYTIDMRSSQLNCVKDKLENYNWTHYGIPDWVDYSKWEVNNPSILEVTTIQKLVKIICTSINKRKTPDSSISTNKNGIYKKDDIIEVIGITKDKFWYKDIDNNYFSNNSEYVVDLIGIVYNCSKLNMRDKDNSKDGKIITVLDANDKLYLLKQSSNGWYYAQTLKGIKGWVSNNYVKL